jgi:hypothetical protein
MVGYYAGLALGACLLIICLRTLGKRAQTSTIFGEVFSFITGYQLRAYIDRQTIISKEDKAIVNNDYKNIILILNQQMGYTKKEAKELAEYAIENTPLESSIEDKIKQALQYQGRNN